MLLLDWKQAYDRVHTRPQAAGQPAPLLDALRRLGVPEEYLLLVDSLYDSTSFFVQDRFSRSKEEPQRTGFRQGDPFSCFLFIALLTVIMHDAEEAWSAAVDPAQLAHSAQMKEAIGRDHSIYADDTNLLSCCLQTLQIMLHAIQTEAARYGLQLNLSKTYLIGLGAARHIQHAHQLVDFSGHVIQSVLAEKTLGFQLGPFVTTNGTIAARGRTMLSRMNQFRRVWRSNLSLKKKVERYYALVVSKGVWGLHLLALKPADFAHLEYIHARCLRRILGLKAAFINHISNKDVLSRARTHVLEACIRRKQLALLGHILRREQEHPDRLVCFQPHTDLQPRAPPGTHRRRGRPRLTWAASILPFIREKIGLDNASIQTQASNRTNWFLLTERLCRSLQP